jgi:cobalamin biosynthesis Mg chelatase CobN
MRLPPVEYPETGLYHPRLKDRITTDAFPSCRGRQIRQRATVGLLLMRSYVLASDTAHYDAVIAAFEERGIAVDTRVRRRARWPACNRLLLQGQRHAVH